MLLPLLQLKAKYWIKDKLKHYAQNKRLKRKVYIQSQAVIQFDGQHSWKCVLYVHMMNRYYIHLRSVMNCLVFKSNSVLGSLPRKFLSHFPSSHMDLAPSRTENNWAILTVRAAAPAVGEQDAGKDTGTTARQSSHKVRFTISSAKRQSSSCDVETVGWMALNDINSLVPTCQTTGWMCCVCFKVLLPCGSYCLSASTQSPFSRMYSWASSLLWVWCTRCTFTLC